MLDSIKKQDFGTEWKCIIFHDVAKTEDAKNTMSIKMAYDRDLGMKKEIIVNEKNKGVDANIIFAMKESARVGNAFSILADDIVILKGYKNLIEFGLKQDSYAISSYIDEVPNARIQDYYYINGYNDIGFGITSEKFKLIIEPMEAFLKNRIIDANGDSLIDNIPTSYDIQTHYYCKANNMWIMRPLVTRCIHIGRYGIHCNENTYFSHLVPRTITSDNFDIPISYNFLGREL